MKKVRTKMVSSFISGIIDGFTLFPNMGKRRKKRNIKFTEVKMNLNHGFVLDKENLCNDWQNIYSDFDRSLKKLQHII